MRLRRRQVLLRGESFAALGSALRREMLKLLGRPRKNHGLAVMMVSHHPDDARHITNRTALVHGGRSLEPAEKARVLSDVRLPELRAYRRGAPGWIRSSEAASCASTPRERRNTTLGRTPHGGTGYGRADFADICRNLNPEYRSPRGHVLHYLAQSSLRPRLSQAAS